jgi:hypothetical protein
MPPRFAYWTILVDNTPTAFRARDREELLPTLTQLRRTNQNVVLKWFAQGRLWESPEAQREAWRKPKAAVEPRNRDWRPGGAHKDPRARFDKEAQRRKKRDARANSHAPKSGAPMRDGEQPPAPARGDRPWGKRPRDKPRDAPRGDRPWKNRPPRPPAPRFDEKGGGWKNRPPGQGHWKPKPAGSGERKPWQERPRGNRPWSDRPPGDRPWQNKPKGPRPDRKPWRPDNAHNDRRKRRDDEPGQN